MWILQLINHRNVIEFDVEVLVDALEGAADGDVVFELDGHGSVDESFEEAAEGGRRVSLFVGQRGVRWQGNEEGMVAFGSLGMEEDGGGKVEGKMWSFVSVGARARRVV